MTLRRATAENAAALDSFLAAKFEIDALLARLREISDMAFGEGEHAR